MTWANESQLVEALRKNDDYLVTTHARADGDAVGAVCAVVLALDRMGKRSRVILDDAYPDPKYTFLAPTSRFTCIEDLDRRQVIPRWALVVDAPSPDRLGRVAAILPPKERILVVDHHATSEPFGGLHLKRAGASSTCEILFGIIRLLGIPVDRELATCLYVGIAFDTNRFGFSNTTPESLEIAARLVRAGVDPEAVSDRVFNERSERSLHLLQAVLATLVVEANGLLASMILPHRVFAAQGGRWEDLEGFVDFAISIRGVMVAAFYKELQPGQVRISFRSRGGFSVMSIARQLGGGGHEMAAGCQVNGEINDVRRRVNSLIVQQLGTLPAPIDDRSR